MAEVPQHMKNDPLQSPSARLQPEPGVQLSGANAHPSMSSQPSKEMLYQQRQKCELRRLLKHTSPELKSLDSAVDEELAEVLSSDRGMTAAETGYEGEVLSRRWMFENCTLSNKTDPLNLKTSMAEGAEERGDVKRSSALLEQPWESLQEERVKGTVIARGQDPNAECEEELVRIDVQSTRRMFENQCVDTFSPTPDTSYGKVMVSGDERGAVQKCKKAFETAGVHKPHGANTKGVCGKQLDSTAVPPKQNTRVAVFEPNTESNLSENQQRFNVIPPIKAVSESPSNQPTLIFKSEDVVEAVENCQIKTREGLFINNPFIATNIDREHPNMCKTKTPCGDSAGDGRASEDSFVANVKNRTQLFESMPFDKIKHQNKDDMETMVENINEILNALYNHKAIHSHGSIIEVNETNLAKRAKYVLSQDRPVIQLDEVAEGGAQNFILQMLPREKLKPQVRYLKEDELGNVQVTIVDALVHQQHLTADYDREFRTATIVQLIEDILDQDNSLRKGVIIQMGENQHAEVTIYSLYNYAEGDVKSYCPPKGHYIEPHQPECAISDDNKPYVDKVKGDVKSTISCLLATGQDQNYSASVRPEVSIKGNVKLFRSCIEKGDLEYLKTLQAESSDDEPSGGSMETNVQQSDPPVQDSEPEWAPVDVKKLKNMFSEASVGQRPVQPKQVFYGNVRHTAKQSPALICQSTKVEKNELVTTYDKSTLPHGLEIGNNLREGVSQEQGSTQDLTAAQGMHPHLDPQADDMVHQAKLVEVVDDHAEISYLQAAICSLQKATEEARASHHATQEQQKHNKQGFSAEHIMSIGRGDKVLKAPDPHQDTREGDKSALTLLPPVSCKTSEQQPDSQCRSIDASCEDMVTEEKRPSECCAAEGQEGTEVVQKGHLKAAIRSLHIAAMEQHKEEKEDIVRGNLQAALDSLGKSSMNTSQGDFRAAMIYRNSSKSHKHQSCKRLDEEPVQKTTEGKDRLLTESEPSPSVTMSQQEQVAMDTLCSATAELPNWGQTTNKLATCSSSDNQLVVLGVPTIENKRPNSSKPAIPPKPDQLKLKGNQSINTRNVNEATQIISAEIKTQSTDEQPLNPMPIKSMSYKDALCKGLSRSDSTDPSISSPDSEKHQHTHDVQKSEEIQSTQQVQGLEVSSRKGIMGNLSSVNDGYVSQPQEMNVTEEKKDSETSSVQGTENETDEKSIDFHEARRKFGGTQEVKKAPVKPKRVRIAKAEDKNQKDAWENSNIQEPKTDKCDEHKGKTEQGSKVVMREKKGKMETEDERRQRLSVHMDEIMRGNITTAMEIFDNLRKQEELHNILTKVEEIEQDTSNVDVKSMRRIFENVPTWVVSPKVKKQKQAKVESTDERSPLAQDNSQSRSSMAHVFGDLERASEEITNLKEQTLARLMDIDEAIKKALYSVSTLKSDSDIAGLSGLFKESLGTVQGSSTSGNIRKISIESSSAKSPQAKGSSSIQREVAQLEIDQRLPPEVQAAKPQTSPQSSPAFISIQSAARKKDTPQLTNPDTSMCSTCQHGPKPEDTFRTTKVFKCNSAHQNKKKDLKKGSLKQSPGNQSNPRCEDKALEVKAVPDGPKTVTENYERTDSFGNRFYSTKTSTVITTQPETVMSFPGQAVTSQCTHQVTTYPEVRLPINTKPKV